MFHIPRKHNINVYLSNDISFITISYFWEKIWHREHGWVISQMCQNEDKHSVHTIPLLNKLNNCFPFVCISFLFLPYSCHSIDFEWRVDRSALKMLNFGTFGLWTNHIHGAVSSLRSNGLQIMRCCWKGKHMSFPMIWH